MHTVIRTHQSIARRLPPVVIVALVAVVMLFVFAPPFVFEVKAKSVAYGICHQIPARSFFIAGHQLPLCARNTGIFLGALFTFVTLFLTGRGRFANLPPMKVLVVLGLFTATMGFDGANSYLTFFPGAPRLYEPSNFLRLTTGAFHGISMALVMFPMFNSVMWQNFEAKPVVAGVRGLGLFIAVALAIIAVVYSQLDFLYYPIASLSVLAVLAMVVMINSTLVLMVLRRENSATSWRDAATPLLIGLVLSLVGLATLGYIRAQLTVALNLPF